MFREARRFKQTLSKEEAEAILSKCTSGVLSLIGDMGYTYGVPIRFGYRAGKIYFHCARTGHKIDALKKHNLVSFTVIAEDQVLPERTSTCYRSVIAFGKALFIDTPTEKREALQILVKKYSPQRIKECEKIIEKKINAVQIICVEIEHLSGKEAIEFAKAKTIG